MAENLFLLRFILFNLLTVVSFNQNPSETCPKSPPSDACQKVQQMDFIIIIQQVNLNDVKAPPDQPPPHLNGLFIGIRGYLEKFLHVMNFRGKYNANGVRAAAIRIDDGRGKLLKQKKARVAMYLNNYTMDIFHQIREVSGFEPAQPGQHFDPQPIHPSLYECLKVLRDEVLVEKHGDRPSIQNMVLGTVIICY